MKSKNLSVIEAAEHWQRCRQEDLPRAFYAYDKKEQQSERVVSYRLKKNTVQRLIDQVGKSEDFNFIVHLGLHPHDLRKPITDSPAFALYLQVYKSEDDWQKKCHKLSWAKNTRFSKNMEDNVNSGVNAIPAASAYLFVHSWLEMHESALSLPFTAATRVMGQRVKAYIFSSAESLSIFEDLKASDQDSLYLHLGNGLAVWDHPFSFRPVLEVPGAVITEGNRLTPRDATGQTNEDGDSFYDFSWPNPPGEP